MKRYKNLSGESGIKAYQAAPKSITVQFNNGGIYRYTYNSAGKWKVELMKELARNGLGLCGFINTHVRSAYAERWRADSDVKETKEDIAWRAGQIRQQELRERWGIPNKPSSRKLAE